MTSTLGTVAELRGALEHSAMPAELHTIDRIEQLSSALDQRWDAVITDERLPDGDGLGVLDCVRLVDRDLPVLMVCDPVGEERTIALLAAGIDDFVPRSQLSRLGHALRQRLRVSHERRFRRATEVELQRNQAELRTALDLLPIGVLVAHGEMITYANRALADYYGVAPARLCGRAIPSLVRQEYHERLRQLLTAGEESPPDGLELRFDRHDGRVGILELTSSSQLEFAGRPARMLTMRDVTRERALSERVQMADRMAAVGTLAAGVAHEINNPLACVTANLEVLREEFSVAPDGAGQRMSHADLVEALDDAREGAERVRLIVRDLRLFARGDAGERGPVDLGGVLQAAERMASTVLKGRARMVQEHVPLPPVDGNATRLCQAFVNLLVNAAQAIEPGRPDENEVRVRVRPDEGGDRVLVEVRDTGSGVPAEVRLRIFDPFFSTKSVGEGHGLGLSVSHGIIHSFGGDISIAEGEGGRGTIVRVSLPVWAV